MEAVLPEPLWDCEKRDASTDALALDSPWATREVTTRERIWDTSTVPRMARPRLAA